MLNDGKANLLLDARAGWRAAALDKTVLWEDGAALQLRALPGSARPLVDAQGDFGGFTSPIGLAVDDQERVYILDGAQHRMLRFDPCACRFEPLSCVGGQGSEPRQLNAPQGLAISCRGDLLIADTGNRRVLVFSIKGLALRRMIGVWKVIRNAPSPPDPLSRVASEGELQVVPSAPMVPPVTAQSLCTEAPQFEAGVWVPADVATAPDGTIYVADSANGLIHRFDCAGNWRDAFDGADSTQEQPALQKPFRLAIDPCGRIYVLQEDKDYVAAFDPIGKFLGRIAQPSGLKGRFCPAAVAVDTFGNLYLSDRITGRLHCYCPTPERLPHAAGSCPEPLGLCAALAFDKAGNPIVAIPQSQRVLTLNAQAGFETRGGFVSEALDSRIYRCQWHRIRVEADIPLGTSVQFETFTSEAPKPIQEILDLPDSRWGTGQLLDRVGAGEWDCLIQSPPGRYLWLRLTLTGEGETTPRLCWMRVHYPRDSSLQYLPAVYRQEETSADFLARYLSLFDLILGDLGKEITQIARYFDPMATPATSDRPGAMDFLSWLASWLGLAVDRHWSEEKRRRLVQHAHELYRLRGTPEGLRLHLKLYLDQEPRILEHFKLRRWLLLGQGRLGDQSALWSERIVSRMQLDRTAQVGANQLVDTGMPVTDPFDVYAHRFTVFIPSCGEPDAQRERTVERIIAMASPAHTLGKVEWTRPRFRIGVQSFIGLDTVVGAYPEESLLERRSEDGTTESGSKLGYDTVLGQPDTEQGAPTLRIGTLSRIGSSARLD